MNVETSRLGYEPPEDAVTALQMDAVSDLETLGFFSWDWCTAEIKLSAGASKMLELPLGASHFDIALFRRLPVTAKARHLRKLRRCLHDGEQQVGISLTFLCRDGDRRQLRASIRPLFEGGELRQLVGALIDQTDKRRSEAELRATMSTVPSAMIVIDELGKIRGFSAAAERMFGRVQSETIGQPIEILMPEPYRSEHAGYLLRYLTTSEARIMGQSRIMYGVRADGSEFPIELWVGDASTDSERLFTGFIRDHTKRFETEAKLQMLQNDLIHVARLSAVGELSMALAHELNQPLGAVVNQLSTADFLAQSGDPANHQRLLDAIRKASDHSMRAGAIVKRLRSFVEKGEADKRIEPVAAIVHEATSLLSSAVRQKGISLKIEIDDRQAAVLADRVQIQQVLFNLLRNAIEALEQRTMERPAISLRVRCLPNGFIEIAVEDNGPGITAERAAEIFTPFSTEKLGGMGVGLSISKRIMEAHGGQLLYTPAVERGARFLLILPAAVNEEGKDG